MAVPAEPQTPKYMLGPVELGSDESDEYLDAYQSDDEDGLKALDHEWQEKLKEMEETK